MRSSSRSRGRRLVGAGPACYGFVSGTPRLPQGVPSLQPKRRASASVILARGEEPTHRKVRSSTCLPTEYESRVGDLGAELITCSMRWQGSR